MLQRMFSKGFPSLLPLAGAGRDQKRESDSGDWASPLGVLRGKTVQLHSDNTGRAPVTSVPDAGQYRDKRMGLWRLGVTARSSPRQDTGQLDEMGRAPGTAEQLRRASNCRLSGLALPAARRSAQSASFGQRAMAGAPDEAPLATRNVSELETIWAGQRHPFV